MVAGSTSVARRIRSAKTNRAAMTHPEAPAAVGFAVARPNEARTSRRARGLAMSGDKDGGAADQAVVHPPTSPRADRGQKAAPELDRAIPIEDQPPAPTHSHTATPTDPRPECRAPSWSGEKDGENESSLITLPMSITMSIGAPLEAPQRGPPISSTARHSRFGQCHPRGSLRSWLLTLRPGDLPCGRRSLT